MVPVKPGIGPLPKDEQRIGYKEEPKGYGALLIFTIILAVVLVIVYFYKKSKLKQDEQQQAQNGYQYVPFDESFNQYGKIDL